MKNEMIKAMINVYAPVVKLVEDARPQLGKNASKIFDDNMVDINNSLDALSSLDDMNKEVYNNVRTIESGIIVCLYQIAIATEALKHD